MSKQHLVVLLIAFAGCVAQSQDSTVGVVEDIKYYNGSGSDDEKHRLDLYLPASDMKAPLLLWIHGGAWAFGDRKAEGQLAGRFAAEGIAVAAISYRLSPATWAEPPKTVGVQHPAHIADVARAFDFLLENANGFGYDHDNIFVGGYSAGGYLSALLVLDGRHLNKVGRDIRDIRASIPLAGAYDLVRYHEVHDSSRGEQFADEHVKGVFGEDLIDSSVTTWVSHAAVPMMVVAESETAGYTKSFEEAVQQAGVTNISFQYLTQETHKSYLADLGASNSKHREAIVDFILEHRNR